MKRNAELAHEWYYAGLEESGKSSGMFYRRGTIYSHGEHWPIAHKLNGSRSVVLFQSKHWGSVSTSTHTSEVRMAIDGAAATVVMLPLTRELIVAIETLSTLPPGRRMNLAEFVHLFGSLYTNVHAAYAKVTDATNGLTKVQRLLAEHELQTAISEWDRVRDFLSRFGLYPLLARKWPVRDKDDWQGEMWRRSANELRKVIREAVRTMEQADAYFKTREQATGDTFSGRWTDYQAKLEARKEQQRAQRHERSWQEGLHWTEEEMAALVQEWREGKSRALPDGAPMCLRLRDGNSVVESSAGVRLPAARFRALAPLVLAAMNNNGEVKRWAELRAAVDEAFSHTPYPVHHVGMDVWVIGCHRIPSSEIVLLANTFTAEEADHAA